MNRPVLIDGYCCAGGAAKGYQRAGFYVIGVDLVDRPSYCGDEFHQGDAIEFIRANAHRADAFHVSPPCQVNCDLTKGTNRDNGVEYPDLIGPTRDVLDAIGKPYVIENVDGSPLRPDVVLCGEMFDLGVIRHRVFELGNWWMLQTPHLVHRGKVAGWRHGEYYDGPYFAVYGAGGGKGSVEQWQQAMGIDWTTSREELREAIPPAYTEYIGAELMAALVLTREATA